MIRLSPRLLAVAELVPQSARVIDVGTDHGRVPVWLAASGRSDHIFASDIRPGPLESAARLVERTGTDDRVFLRQTDGLHGFSRKDADTVIIAGMGGETMVDIISAAPWLGEDVLLILEPQSKQSELRRWLWENGFSVESERLVEDAGRIYPILTARSGTSPSYEPAELWIGRWEQIEGDPLLPAYLRRLIKRAAAAAPYDIDAEKLLAALQKKEKRLVP